MFQKDHLLLKIKLACGPEKLFRLLTTDQGREKFWAEKSRESENVITFFFPNGQTQNSRILKIVPNQHFEIEYFNSLVQFHILPLPEKGCILELNNSNIPAADRFEQFAGWVSVLLSLKAYANFGIDLRNHHTDYTWDQHFVEN